MGQGSEFIGSLSPAARGLFFFLKGVWARHTADSTPPSTVRFDPPRENYSSRPADSISHWVVSGHVTWTDLSWLRGLALFRGCTAPAHHKQPQCDGDATQCCRAEKHWHAVTLIHSQAFHRWASSVFVTVAVCTGQAEIKSDWTPSKMSVLLFCGFPFGFFFFEAKQSSGRKWWRCNGPLSVWKPSHRQWWLRYLF